MKVYGKLENADLESLSADPTPASLGRVYYNTTLGQVRYYNGSSWLTVGSGSSSGINYISSNPDAEAGTTGWSTYADAAGALPVYGTGGSPVTTWTRSTSSPLRGSGSFLLTKDAANRQGEGVSFAFTLDNADLAKPLTITFDHTVGSGTYATGDVAVYIYNVSNSEIIQPSGYQVLSTTAGVPYKTIASFQTSASGTSYRLILHVASTSASAYTVKFDNFKVGPDSATQGTPTEDFKLDSGFTPASGAFGTVTLQSLWRARVGDRMLARGYFKTGTIAGGTISIALPSGIYIDSTKFNSVQGNRVGTWTAVRSGANANISGSNYEGPIFYNGSTTNAVFFALSTGSNVLNQAIGTDIFTTNDGVTVQFEVPISGWSSNVALSDSSDQRVVAFQGSMAAQAPQTLSATTASTLSSVRDTHSAFSSNTYTIPVQGYYVIMWDANGGTENPSATGQKIQANIMKNGSLLKRGELAAQATGSLASWPVSAFITELFSAGDTITVNVASNFNTPGTTATGILSINRISGPAVVAASEKIYLTYVTNGGTSLTANTTNADWSTKVVDSHGAWSGSVFTAPRPDFYHIQGQAKMSATSNNLQFYKNGSNTLRVYGIGSQALKPFSFSYYLNAGDTLSIRSDGSDTLSASTTDHWISISSQ